MAIFWELVDTENIHYVMGTKMFPKISTLKNCLMQDSVLGAKVAGTIFVP